MLLLLLPPPPHPLTIASRAAVRSNVAIPPTSLRLKQSGMHSRPAIQGSIPSKTVGCVSSMALAATVCTVMATGVEVVAAVSVSGEGTVQVAPAGAPVQVKVTTPA